MARDDDQWGQDFDLVDADYPGESGPLVGQGEPHVDPVAGDVAANHSVEVGDVYDGRRISIALTDVEEAELVALHVDRLPSSGSGSTGWAGIWPGKWPFQ